MKIVDYKSNNNNLTLSFEDINVEYYNKKTKTSRTILNNLTGSISSGSCLAIMGGSGAGKTTFLNIISGRFSQKGLKKTGNIYLNGKHLDYNKFKSNIGFVMQSDLFFEFLTVRQCFNFAAELRMPKSTKEEREERINYIIKILKLEKAENTIVGGKMAKGISGGEKKRLNIGFEMISDPEILFLDEPTSGLDSYTSYVIINLLKELAESKNMIIVYTIHQPSTDIFMKFDNLMLLNRGKIIYFGECDNSINYFMDNGYKCPEGYNPADYFMKLMQSKDKLQLENLEDNYDRVQKNDIYDKFKKSMENVTDTELKSEYASFGRQFGSLLKRAFLNFKSNPFSIKIRVVQTLFITFIYCSIFFRISDDPNNKTSAFNRQGALFFVCVNTFINYLMSVLLTFPAERDVFLKEYGSGFYGILPYYLSKLAVELPIISLFPFISGLIYYYIVNFNNDAVRLFSHLGGLIVLSIVGSMFGMFIGTVITDFSIALEIAPLFFLPMMLFSGYTSNTETIVKGLKWIEYISPIRYTFEYLIYNEFEGTAYKNNPIDLLNFTLGMEKCIGILTAIGVCFMLLSLIFLKVKAKMLN